jgi:hypothetical protein
MLMVAASEGLKVNEAAMKELAVQANQDIRLLLGQLQMWRLRRDQIRCGLPLPLAATAAHEPSLCRPAFLVAPHTPTAHRLKPTPT